MVLKITNLHILRYLPTCWLYLLECYTIDNQRCTHTASTIIISQSCLDLLFVNTYKCYNNDIQLNINKISIDKVTTNDIPFRMLEKYPR